MKTMKVSTASGQQMTQKIWRISLCWVLDDSFRTSFLKTVWTCHLSLLCHPHIWYPAMLCKDNKRPNWTPSKGNEEDSKRKHCMIEDAKSMCPSDLKSSRKPRCKKSRADVAESKWHVLCTKSKEAEWTKSKADGKRPIQLKPSINISGSRCAGDRKDGLKPKCKKSRADSTKPR